MAEKGTLILDQAGGTSIATRDAAEMDELSTNRVIQRFDKVCGEYTTPIATPNRAALTTADGATFGSLPAEIINNLITCGDKSRVAVMTEFLGVATSDNARIALLWYDNEATPGYLGYSEFQSFQTDPDMGPIHDGTVTRSYIRTWDIPGAARVGIYVPGLFLSGCTSVDVFAFVI